MSNSPSLNPMSAASPSDPFEGTDYRMLSHVGSGGMADVFVVEHRRLSMKYAAKLLHKSYASDERTVDRMRLEADALAKLDHDNIIQIHAIHDTPLGLPFIVMDLLHGKTLRDHLLDRGTLPLSMVLVLALDLLNGLEAVHRIGIVHRDLKPSNLFIHVDPETGPVLKLLDFGVARVIPGISEDAPTPLTFPTRTGAAVGTPMFMSPEAAMGRAVDVRTDIYAAANVIYLMLAGRGPFDDQGDLEAVLKAHATKPPPPVSQFAQEPIPLALEQAVAKALEKDPQQRFQTAHEFGEAIYGVFVAWQKSCTADNVSGKVDVPYAASPTLAEPRGQVEGRKGLALAKVTQLGVLLLLLFASIALGLFVIQQSLR